MRLGIAGGVSHRTPEEWAEKQYNLGCGAVVLPLDYRADDSVIDSYVKACVDYGLIIAEVGAWCNPMSSVKSERSKNVAYIKEQLRFADRVGARCCVNIAGTSGEVWDGGYIENYSDDMYNRIVETVREIIDDVKPSNTYYTLEPMPWMIPHSPESYLKLMDDIGSDRFAAHLDVVNMINCPERYFFNGDFIEKCFSLLNEHIRCCHVKDVRLERFLTFNLKETYCGDGNLDIKKYAISAHKCDVDMPFMIEHLSTEEEYINSLRYIQELIKDVSW